MTTRTQSVGQDIPRWGWQEDAVCREQDLELFFGYEGEPKRARLARERRALAVCAGCPVREMCLRHAETAPERYGVWGGTTEEQRSGSRRERRPSAA